MTTHEIDWTTWVPTDEATLLYVIRGGSVLLIRKKRGLGAGKVNGPGGKVEPGEDPLTAAIREFEEELRATPVGVEKGGLLLFQLVGGAGIRIHVFRAHSVAGSLQETDEAEPMWVTFGEVPYDRMWAADRCWLPLLLAGEPFEARTQYDGERLLSCEVGVPGS